MHIFKIKFKIKSMRKLHLIIIILLMFFASLSASRRNESEARQIAENHFNNTNYTSGKQKAPDSNNLQLVYTLKENEAVESDGLIYVFNKGENNGFVIISGSDKANTILGYANTGTFNAGKIPDGLNFWLNSFAKEIKWVEHITENKLFEVKTSETSIQKIKSATQFSSSINPLLGSIKWNQGEPYNNLCPLIPGTSQRTVTGCAATAMAQVMKYHQWPASGTGSNSYTTETYKIPLSVNFSATTYDWANMTTSYNSASTEIQKNAVATLMYHCGVATNMDYAESSGTTSQRVASALINNFGYDANLNLIHRDYYTRNEWINFLKTELNALRPVLYAGQSSSGGHLFVCDGYDTNDYFHFNWGWGGMSDGYYAITALNPSSQGIGGSSGGYNSDQDIVIGMQQPNPTTISANYIYMREPLTSSNQSVQRNAKTTIYLKKTYNFGVNTFNGEIGIGLYTDNNLVSVLQSFNTQLQPNYGYTDKSLNNVSIPSGVANGTYKLHTIYKATGQTTWSIVRGYVGTPNYMYVQVSSNNVTYNNVTDFGPNLTLNSVSATGTVYKDKTGRFVVEITNSGEEYNSILGVYLQSKTNSSIYQLITEDANITTNETASYYINKTITLDPGEYYLAAMYDPNNIRATASSLSQLGNVQTVNILPTPTATPVFSLTTQIAFPNNNDVNKEYDVLTANIINTGGYFENKMIAFVFPTTGGSSLTYIGYQDAYFDTNEQKNVNFAGGINLDANQYRIVTYYHNGSGWVRLLPSESSATLFTIQPEFTTVENIPEEIQELKIYPNPATDYISFYSEKIVDNISVYQIDGKLIHQAAPEKNGNIRIDVKYLKSGNYLLQVNCSGKLQIGSFIKQ